MALQHAACIGHEFDTFTLALISEQPASQVNQALWPALRDGLLIPLDGNYGLLDRELDSGSALLARYRFLHDRVQQAAYALVDVEGRQQAHLGIARHLQQGSSASSSQERLFDIVDHFNRAVALITDPVEKQLVARLNLQAGDKARRAAAPQTAANYYDASLGASCADWSKQFDLVYRAHLGKAGCELLTGNIDEALRLLDEVERHATTPQQKVPARQTKIVALTMLNRLDEACATAVDTVRLLGLDLPEPTDKAALGAAIQASFGAFQGALAGREIRSLAGGERMTDETQLSVIDTLAAAIPASFLSNQELNVLFVVEAARASVRHGTAPASPFFYAQYGIVHIVVTGDTKTAFEFGELALALVERPEHAAVSSHVHFLYASFLAHWRRHISDSYAHFRTALKLGLETGDVVYASYSTAFEALCRVLSGTPFLDAVPSIEAGLGLAASDDIITRMFLQLAQRTVHDLSGRFPEAALGFDAATFEQGAPPPILAVYGALKAMTCWLAREPEQALRATDQFPPLPASFYNADFVFYRALCLASAVEAAAEAERPALLLKLTGEGDKLRAWAKDAPENHGQRATLIDAELAKLSGEQLIAMDLYDAAIEKAQQGGFYLHQAIAGEQCARMLHGAGRQRAARSYLAEAHWAYLQWGAASKGQALVEEFPQLLGEPLRAASHQQANATLQATSQQNVVSVSAAANASMRLDLASAIRATEAIATELVLDRVLERLVRTLMENAGAQRGALLLQQDGELVLEARGRIEPDQVEVGLRQPLAPDTNLATSIAEYTARSLQPCVVADAKLDSRFSQDPYVVQAGLRSVLCVPMLHLGKLTGVLYLENNASAGVFSPDRSELLQFLAAQAAVAVENARLYGEVHAGRDLLRQANETLEAEVAERTEQLQRTLADLWGEMDLARKIQTVLLPENTRVGDYQIAASMVTADEVGGDYYDIVRAGAGGYDWVLIGDVSGHGVSAGLIMMMIQTAVRSIVLSADSPTKLTPATLLTLVNRAVRENLLRVGEGQYMTLTAFRIEGSQLRFAGLHLDVLVYRRERQVVEVVETDGAWIGLLDDITGLLDDATLSLEPGDVVLLFTDGVTELKLGEHMLGTSGLSARFHEVARLAQTPEAIVKNLLAPLQGVPSDDDLTLMALWYAPQKAAK